MVLVPVEVRIGYNPLELKLQMVVSHNIGAGNRAQCLYESNKSF